MRRKEMANLLEERAERILLLEQRMENQNQQLESYRAREQSIVESFTVSQQEAKQRVEAAQSRAAELVQEAGKQASAAVAAAQAQADALIAEAQVRAEEILNAAKSESADLRNKTRIACAEHEEWNAQYKEVLAAAAAQAKTGAEKFAAILQKCGVEMPQASETAQQGEQSEPVRVALPDAENDPAKLMRNIYTLQNRDIPQSVRPNETVVSTVTAEQTQPAQADQSLKAEQDVPTIQESAETDDVPDLAPRPEKEWQPEDEADAAREWQPEVEPEMSDIPTVSELMPDMGSDELSLDALLDEIIKAGE